MFFGSLTDGRKLAYLVLFATLLHCYYCTLSHSNFTARQPCVSTAKRKTELFIVIAFHYTTISELKPPVLYNVNRN